MRVGVLSHLVWGWRFFKSPQSFPGAQNGPRRPLHWQGQATRMPGHRESGEGGSQTGKYHNPHKFVQGIRTGPQTLLLAVTQGCMGFQRNQA